MFYEVHWSIFDLSFYLRLSDLTEQRPSMSLEVLPKFVSSTLDKKVFLASEEGGNYINIYI